MRRTPVLVLVAAGAAVAVADDAPKDDGPEISGSARAGWRFMSGEGDGRFPQDFGWKEGPRLFDLDVDAKDRSGSAYFDDAQAHLSGIGDPFSDSALTLRRSGLLELSGGYRRDDVNYRASGDFFSYDTTRERGYVHGKWTPDRSLTVRFSWDRDDRRGDAWTRGYLFLEPLTRTENPSDVAQVRPLDSARDAFSLGADWSVGIFRLGLTQSVALSRISDERSFEVPPSQNDGFATRGEFRNEICATTSTTVGKAGATLFDGAVDATLFVTRTGMPLRSNLTDLERGADSAGLPSSRRTTQDLDIDREAWNERIEIAWRPHDDWEFTGAAEYDALADDADRHLDRTSGGSRTAFDADYRSADRNRRFSVDATWQASDEVKLRVGEQFLRESLFVPTDRQLAFLPPDLDPLDPASFFPGRFVRGLEARTFETDAWRTTGGIDWKPAKGLTTGILAHVTTDERQQATPSPHASRDFTARSRWQATDAMSFATVWRHFEGHTLFGVPYSAVGATPGHRTPLDFHDRFLVGDSRSDSYTASSTWSGGPWSVTGSFTWRDLHTSADTQFLRGSTPVYTTTDFGEREAIANVDVRWDATKTLRFHTALTRTAAHGDLPARWLQAAVGSEYDLRADLTVGVTVSTWRLDDDDAPADSYRVYGTEVYLTWRF